MTRRAPRIFLLAVILAALGVVSYKAARTLWSRSSLELQKKTVKLLDYVPEATLQIKNFHRVKVEGEHKVWELAGEEASYFKAEKEAVVKKPRIIFYQNGGQAIEVRGDEGRIFFTGQEMEKAQLHGSIQIHYRGLILSTEEVIYFKSTDRVVSPGKVIFKGEGWELEGIGMEISLKDQKLRLLQKVRSKIEPGDGKTRGAYG